MTPLLLLNDAVQIFKIFSEILNRTIHLFNISYMLKRRRRNDNGLTEANTINALAYIEFNSPVSTI